MKPLILASSSPNRRTLLKQLGIPFECISPDIDETPHNGESAHTLSMRLSAEKARKIASTNPDAVIIGSDQVGALGEQFINKPLTHEQACKQWAQLSGQTIVFYTGVAVISGTNEAVKCVTTEVKFRRVSEAQIQQYLIKDKPYNCCAGFKVESLGIAMTQWVKSDDPSALIGLPLITTSVMLENVGLNPLS